MKARDMSERGWHPLWSQPRCPLCILGLAPAKARGGGERMKPERGSGSAALA